MTDTPDRQRAWLVLAVGSSRQHGGNEGYDDDPDAHYSWDSTVAHARSIAVGDRIVLWDKVAVIGASVVDRIDTGPGEKIVYRCAHCGRSGIKQRKHKQPRFHCYECARTFDEPVASISRVTTYRSHHEESWIDLQRCLDGAALRALCVQPRSQLSMRPLRWEEFCTELERRNRRSEVRDLQRLDSWTGQPRGGHRTGRVRVRIGQAAFRDRLLIMQGPCCAITGPAPPAALEAAHLYSYARLGEHRDDGGLLLRRDIHHLFDRGQIALDPSTLLINIRADLRAYPTYRALDGKPAAVGFTGGQIEWLRLHWLQHRIQEP